MTITFVNLKSFKDGEIEISILKKWNKDDNDSIR